MSKGVIKIAPGMMVRNKSGREGIVKNLAPIRGTGRGRPKTLVTVHHAEGPADYSVSELTPIEV